MLATLFLSQGVPMLLGGDEFNRTQRGNNNAYCQDNEISWFDWNHDDAAQDMIRFVRRLTRIRRDFPLLRRRRFFRGRPTTRMASRTFPGSPGWQGHDRNRLVGRCEFDRLAAGRR